MQISIGTDKNDLKHFRAQTVSSVETLAKLITKVNYSLGTFKENIRRKDNFVQTEAIGLDFDGGYSLEQALKDFSSYRHIIAPTRSHRKEKNGVIEDRFRVILFLLTPIVDADTFEATWRSLYAKFPAADVQCKDASRFFYPSATVESFSEAGDFVAAVPYVHVKIDKPEYDFSTLSPDARGKLSRATLEFLLNGVPQGGRNHAVFKVAKEFQQNLYSLEETEARILEALNRTDTIASDFSESEALSTVRSAFNTEAKHEPRITPPAPPTFHLKQIGELYNETHGAEVEWLVDGLLQVAGVSLLAADPKAGKSVIARQLCASILTGQPFFTRTVRKGECHYYGLEEHPTIVARSFSILGVAGDAPLFVHCGDPLNDENVFAEFAKLIMEKKPALAIIDTAFDLIEVESENNYRDVKRALKDVRTIARNSGTHIVLIHHAGKPQQDNKRRGNHAVLGSTAIVGGVDAIMVIQIMGATRVIYSSGREVEPWNGRILNWDSRTKTYSLGKPYDDFN